MSEIFILPNTATLFMLILLPAVLGFGNLLYISPESKKVEEKKRARVRVIGLAIFPRIGLSFLLIRLIGLFEDLLFEINLGEFWYSKFYGHSIIVLLGGGFIVYTAMKEIWKMISYESLNQEKVEKKKTVKRTNQIFQINYE